MKYIHISCLAILLIMNMTSSAQVINGTWTGNYAKTLLSYNPTSLVIELSLYSDSMITGASHLYYDGGRYEHHKLTGK